MDFVEVSPSHEDLVHDIAFDYYGKRFATCSSDKHIKIWTLDEEKTLGCLMIFLELIKTVYGVFHGQILSMANFLHPVRKTTPFVYGKNRSQPLLPTVHKIVGKKLNLLVTRDQLMMLSFVIAA